MDLSLVTATVVIPSLGVQAHTVRGKLYETWALTDGNDLGWCGNQLCKVLKPSREAEKKKTNQRSLFGCLKGKYSRIYVKSVSRGKLTE